MLAVTIDALVVIGTRLFTEYLRVGNAGALDLDCFVLCAVRFITGIEFNFLANYTAATYQ